MNSIFTKILLLIFVLIICYMIYYVYYDQYYSSKNNCNLENFNIDDLVIIKRTPEYSKLINNIIDKKSFIFDNKQIKILKNPQQLFKVTNDQNNISNISDIIYKNCKGKLDSQLNNNIDNNLIENFDNNIINVSDNEYNKIKNNLKNDIEKLIKLNCSNIGVLKNNIPFAKNYLNNYYKDLYGNRIQANLGDYFTAYYTLINQNENVGFPVNTQIGHSDFIIPDQYKTDSHFTNAYNIDWDRIINPIGYSM